MTSTVTPDELAAILSGPNPPRVIDVRRLADRQVEPAGIPGAEWKDPEKVAEWGKDIENTEVVVYCVRGGSVSRSVQEKLHDLNISVKFIEGGLEAWKRSGRSVM